MPPWAALAPHWSCRPRPRGQGRTRAPCALATEGVSSELPPSTTITSAIPRTRLKASSVAPIERASFSVGMTTETERSSDATGFSIGRKLEGLAGGAHHQRAGSQGFCVVGKEHRAIGGFAGSEFGGHQRNGGSRGGRFELGRRHLGQRTAAAHLVSVGGLQPRVAGEAGVGGGAARPH